MSICGVISIFNRLNLSNSVCPIVSRGVTTNACLWFKTSPILLAEPLKKKKRLDPAIIRAREDRKKRKIEKQIRRLEKNAKQLKPLEECELPLHVLDDKKNRERNIKVSEAVEEQRILLKKRWSSYKQQEHLKDLLIIDKLSFSQQKALDQLKIVSEELYQAAIEIDETLMPFSSEGPKETPPIDGYDIPDGDYKDVSKIW